MEAAELSDRGRNLRCAFCHGLQRSIDKQTMVKIHEPDWPDCADCELKCGTYSDMLYVNHFNIFIFSDMY